METTKTLFYSKMQHPKLVMETKKTFKSDGEAAQGKVIQFDRHHFETSDPETIEFIRQHPLFGHEYVEVQARKNEPAPVGKPTVGGMDGEDDKKMQAFEGRILAQVDAKLDAVVDRIAEMIPQEAPEAKKTGRKKKGTEKDDTTDTDKKEDETVASQNK